MQHYYKKLLTNPNICLFVFFTKPIITIVSDHYHKKYIIWLPTVNKLTVHQPHAQSAGGIPQAQRTVKVNINKSQVSTQYRKLPTHTQPNTVVYKVFTIIHINCYEY